MASPHPEFPTNTFEPCPKTVGIQTPELPSVHYASLQDHRQRFYREQVTDLFSDGVFYNKLLLLVMLLQGGWQLKGRNCFIFTQSSHQLPKSQGLNDYTISSDVKILDSLVRDYNLTKNKELAKQTREKKRALKDKIKIGDSLKTSSIPNDHLGTKKKRAE